MGYQGTYNRRAKDQMQGTLDRLNAITSDCRIDMHEPDEQEVDAAFSGYVLDNAMGDNPTNNFGEMTVGIINAGGDREWFNLATLIAMAKLADLS